jgi:excisionase family DNA binding protein
MFVTIDINGVIGIKKMEEIEQSSSNVNDDPLLTTTDAAKYLHMSKMTFLRRVAEYNIPNESMTKHKKFRRSELDKFLERWRQEQQKPSEP